MKMRKRSKHNLSHFNMTTFDIGKLYPVSYIECLPGDSIQMQTKALIRFSPLVKPILHPIEARIHHFFVPFRIMWDGWEDFITGESATPPPTVSVPTHSNTSIYSYCGASGGGSNISAFPMRAYNMIWNEYYRDQDLSTEATLDQVFIKRIAWEKDYFTAARPWAQKGTAVTIPIGGTAPVVSTNQNITFDQAAGANEANLAIDGAGGVNGLNYTGADNTALRFGASTGLQADLSSATTVSAVDFREAFALQRYQEARARYGSEYVDYLRYLGIKPRDGRLSRPEYLAGGKSWINISEVLNTGDYTADIGELYGHGIAAMESNQFRRFIEEHGVIMTMVSLRPVVAYGDGLPRKFTRSTKEDFYQVELERIGQQEILNQELRTVHATPLGTFGYTDRYREYREEHNIVTGEMRLSALDDWHMGRLFSTDPALNQTFVEIDDATVNRPFASTAYDHTRAVVRNNIVARRLVSRNADPILK